MTFWYMEKIGEVIYSKSMPKGWEEMKPAEAGQNAAKMMLYYAILRCRTIREEQRAIALYNSYGFGYTLGMNYRNTEGRREMLWPQDLRLRSSLQARPRTGALYVKFKYQYFILGSDLRLLFFEISLAGLLINPKNDVAG